MVIDMDFTQDPDGHLRTDLDVTHRVGREELISAALHLVLVAEGHGLSPSAYAESLTAGDIEACLHSLLVDEGRDGLVWGREPPWAAPRETIAEARPLAATRVDVLWPVLVSAVPRTLFVGD